MKDGRPHPNRKRPRSVEELWNEYSHLPDEELEKVVANFTTDELTRIQQAEFKGWRKDDLPIDLAEQQHLALESLYYFVTEVCDAIDKADYYKTHLEPVHREVLDSVIAPYMRCEPVTIGGETHDPGQYIGLLILMSRSTFKSSLAGLAVLYHMLWLKHRRNEDARVMYVHQQIEKAVERGEVIRSHARFNPKFRELFPKFNAPKGEWDRSDKWRWPCYQTHGAAEFSFKAYGETSRKTGGHFTLRTIDDWEDEDSVSTPDQLRKSLSRFRMMDNLKDRAREYNPYLIMGTNYHFQGLHAVLERQGGYLVYKVPAHTGSPKVIFDCASISLATDAGRKKSAKALKAIEENPPGKLNFPHLLSWKELVMTARASGPNHYNTQMLLNPVPEGEERFDHELIDAALTKELPPTGDTWIYIRCDPAIGLKRKNDETAILVGGVTWNGLRWIVDGWCGRENRPTEIVRKLFRFAYRWQDAGYTVKNIGIESVQYQEALAMLCRSGVPERDNADHGSEVTIVRAPEGCAVRSIKRSADMRKQERILEMDGPVTRRELRIWQECPVADKLVQQFKHFPMDRDDLLDAMHDMWTGTPLPPRVKSPEQITTRQKIREILGIGVPRKTPMLTGTNATVRLQGWK